MNAFSCDLQDYIHYFFLMVITFTLYWQSSTDAFGEHGRDATDGFPAIPSNATLNIDLELVSFKPVINVSGNLSVLKKILKEGEGMRSPNEGAVAHGKFCFVSLQL